MIPDLTMDEIEPLFERVESYGFECEAGPLKNCVEWIELKRRVAELDAAFMAEL